MIDDERQAIFAISLKWGYPPHVVETWPYLTIMECAKYLEMMADARKRAARKRR